ncbi:MAG: Helix-turn-helix, AraC domain protein [Solirubrobacterales bacterium]|nr:Helix-turn-helix, AraC domain protein [Solirubrobacterales bacterium]
MVTYREHPVPAALRWAVACGWTLEVGPAPVSGWRVLPDTHMDIVAVSGQAVRLAGPATTVQLIDLPAGGGVAGLRLAPGTAPALLGVPADAVRDASPDLADVWRPARRWDQDHLRGLTDTRSRLHVLYRLLALELHDAATPDRLVRRAVHALSAGRLPVARLAHDTGLTQRQLLRRFDAAVGYGPKRLQRIARLQRGLAAHQREPGLGLAELAAGIGYADQAHLTRDWVALTGVTPRVLLHERRVTLDS